MTGPRPLLHLPIYAAACTGLYAGSLALVTMLQAQHNAAVALEQAPLIDAVSSAESARRGTEEALRAASGALGNASDGYAAATALSAQVDAAMAAFAKQVAAVTGVAGRLPTSVRLPAAPGAVAHVTAPTTQATTGASGK
ncbi:MAG: hypothetical protein M3P32_01265 [Chloroflexota bacterium]|nr:hypothetical protein [Chloroflexota bacterium]